MKTEEAFDELARKQGAWGGHLGVCTMKEKYSFGWTDPRAMYGEPNVKWEFLEAQPWPPNVRPYLHALMIFVFIFVVVVL